MTTETAEEKKIVLTGVVVREREDVLTIRLEDGFSKQEIQAHRSCVTEIK